MDTEVVYIGVCVCACIVLSWQPGFYQRGCSCLLSPQRRRAEGREDGEQRTEEEIERARERERDNEGEKET